MKDGMHELKGIDQRIDGNKAGAFESRAVSADMKLDRFDRRHYLSVASLKGLEKSIDYRMFGGLFDIIWTYDRES